MRAGVEPFEVAWDCESKPGYAIPRTEIAQVLCELFGLLIGYRGRLKEIGPKELDLVNSWVRPPLTRMETVKYLAQHIDVFRWPAQRPGVADGLKKVASRGTVMGTLGPRGRGERELERGVQDRATRELSREIRRGGR